MQVEQEAVCHGRCAQRGPGLVEGAREADPVAELLETGTQHEPDMRLVVDYKQVP